MSYLGYSQWRRIARIVGAVALGYVSIWDPSIAAAELIGMIQTGGIVNPNFFGTIDPGTGAVAPLGTATFASGKYATTYDPVRDIFYVSDVPTNNGTSFSSQIREINGKTGAETDIFLSGAGGFAFLAGLEVRNTGIAAAPEPPTVLLLLGGLLGIVLYARRGPRSTLR